MTDLKVGFLADDVRAACYEAGAALYDNLATLPGKDHASSSLMVEVMAIQSKALQQFWGRAGSDPEAAELLASVSEGFMEDILSVSGEPEQDGSEVNTDRRFSDPLWNSHRGFRQLRQFYDRLSRRIMTSADNLAVSDKSGGNRELFLTRLMLEAFCPTNNFLTNPAALRRVVETDGDSLARSLSNLVNRLDVETGRLKPPMSPAGAFTPGVDIAVTDGYVIAENELCQLVIYEPDEAVQQGLPVMIVPPWINKFYILDLRPQNSLIKWLTEQGHYVCVLSWVNPGPEMAGISFEDYMQSGPLEMGARLCDLLGVQTYHAVGYCLGGTLLAATAAWYAAGSEAGPASYSFLTTLLDFSEPGDLGAFVSPELLAVLDEHMEKAGYLDGNEMSDVFSFLRSRDLFWNFYIEHFLMGRDPRPFDILHWNADNTRMPAAMHSYYLRNMYRDNKLIEPGALQLAGRMINLESVDRPNYFLATEEDHIAPWRSVWSGARRFGGKTEFVLAGSGHVAGVINSPTQQKYGFRDLSSELASGTGPDEASASVLPESGSWWPHWKKFLGDASGAAKFRAIISPRSRAIEPAPGRYVLKK